MILKYDSNGDGTANQAVSNILSHPDITSRLDQVGTCNFSIVDKLGALYATWEALDNIAFLIEDDSSNVIFRGYIIEKRYNHNEIHVQAKGIGAILEWKHFQQNYIAAEGTVLAVPSTEDSFSGQTQWLYTTATDTSGFTPDVGAEHECLDDTYDDPMGGNDDVTIEDDDDNNHSIYQLTNATAASVQTVVVYIYCMRYGDAIEHTCDISWDNWVSSDGAVGWTAGAGARGWKTCTFDVSDENGGDGLTQEELTALEIRIDANAVIPMGDDVRMYAMPVKITYTGTSDYTIEVEEDTEDEDKTFSWSPDTWIADDYGLLITDNTSGFDSNTWKCDDNPFDLHNETFEDGVAADTQVLNDVQQHIWSGGIVTMYCNYDMDLGDNVDDDKILDHIDVCFHIMCIAGSLSQSFNVYFLKDDEYVLKRSYWAGAFGPWSFWDTVSIYDDVSDYLHTAGGSHTGFTKIKIEVIGHINTCNVAVDYLAATLFYSDVAIDPIMETITDSGDEWIECSGLNLVTSGVTGRADADTAGDRWKIGHNTTSIIGDMSGKLVNVDGSGVDGVKIQSTLSKYIARNYRGVYCMEVLKNVCSLEGVHWWEDYENNMIVISHEDDFEDSTVNLTNTDFDWDWEIHDEANDISRVDVYGNAALAIHKTVYSTTSSSPREYIHVDDKIMTGADAEDVAKSILAEKEVKQTQIKLKLQGLNANLTVGTTLDLDIDNPNIDATFPISKIVRKKGAYVSTDDIWTEVYLGMGSTTPEEKLMDRINLIREEARRASTDKLSTTTFSAGGNIDWGDIGGTTAGVEGIITAELVGGQSIDNAIDTLIAASGHMDDVVDDTTPQLGGNLDVNTKLITSPDGTDQIDVNDGNIQFLTASSERMDIDDSGVQLGGANARVTTILDEDAMGSDSATSLATQQSIKKYVDDNATDYDADLMIGSANAAWVPCIYTHGNLTSITFKLNAGTFENFNASDAHHGWELPLPMNRGGKKLYITKFRIGVFDADANDYVDTLYVRYQTYGASGLLHSDLTNRTAINTYTYTFAAAKDCSTYERVLADLYFVLTGAAQMNMTGFEMECYYDT